MTRDLSNICGVIFQHLGALGYIETISWKDVQICWNCTIQNYTPQCMKAMATIWEKYLRTDNANAIFQAIVYVNVFHSITFYIQKWNYFRNSNDCLRFLIGSLLWEDTRKKPQIDFHDEIRYLLFSRRSKRIQSFRYNGVNPESGTDGLPSFTCLNLFTRFCRRFWNGPERHWNTTDCFLFTYITYHSII